MKGLRGLILAWSASLVVTGQHCERDPDPVMKHSLLQVGDKKSHARVTTHLEASHNHIELPAGTTAVKINIGTSYDPVLHCDAHGSVVCLYFDIQHDVIETLRKKFHENKNVIALWLGVSNYTGIASLRKMGLNDMGESSSLSAPSQKRVWNQRDQGMDFAPVTTFAAILDSIPADIDIPEVVTDMQGHDFAAAASAAERIKRVRTYRAEVEAGAQGAYDGPENFLKGNWLPHMQTMGFSLHKCSLAYKDSASTLENDCIFKNQHM